MADPASYGNYERDIEQALIILKKGSQLIKYSRKGKPKLCPFRISTDETTLIWYSHGEERTLKLSSISRIIPGQRTAVFRRYLRPEKEYLSFSLLYRNGERSLDLICKDKGEAEVWLVGLKNLISSRLQHGRSRSDLPDLQDASEFFQSGRNFGATLEFSNSLARGRDSIDLNSRESSLHLVSSDVGSERANMQRSGGDGFRISVSSTPSCSSGGSGPDDIESLGDVYVWGGIWSDLVLPDGTSSPIPVKNDVLIPKPLETNVVLDVHQIACGVRHIALVTRQGEVFTWGEECGGRLGHGVDRDFSRPRLVEFLAVSNVDFVACGEYHSCAITSSNDLFSWGDGIFSSGILGHGTDVSHWIPKRVVGPLEGLQVLSVACGTWHSALATSNGKLYTFGDGTYGVLGHGDRESIAYPREVQLLSGLRTIKVACGIWHTAAIVEVMGQTGSNMSSRKLFTWGDGDKYRLGHGNKETYLLPTCVSSLIDYNFHQLACGHNMTVALTTSGHVFTMGGTAYGQLGNPSSDGVIPCLVQDRLVGEFVEEISCGASHTVVLTSRNEVFSWGRGANGRLGHGDVEDRRSPTLVEALKDRHVKSISCGSNFTASICIHKWVSGADQSVCTGCRQAFGFTKKRHNCYNCGLVHCHSCSSKKALKAALAPTPGKPHRVCDSCYAKLKAAEAGNNLAINRKLTASRHSTDYKERFDRVEVRTSRVLLSPTTEPVKYHEIKSVKPGSRPSSPSMVRASQVPSLQQLKDIAFPSSLSAIQNAWRPATVAPASPPPMCNSRPVSPYSRRPSPPRSSTPGFSKTVIDSLKRSNETLRKSNETLTQENSRLERQVYSLKQKVDTQDTEIRNLCKNVSEVASLVEEESSRCKIAKKLVTTITDQLKEMTEKLPPEISDGETFKAMYAQAEAFLNMVETSKTSSLPTSREKSDTPNNGSTPSLADSSKRLEDDLVTSGMKDLTQVNVNNLLESKKTSAREAVSQSTENGSRSPLSSTPPTGSEKQVIEQFEPGVYVTLVVLSNDTKIFKRVRFSKRKFDEQQAEDWWSKNKDRLLKRYNPSTSYSTPTGSPKIQSSAEESNEAPTTPKLDV
ncbi:PH, RCC1 and FYVE domains-containing protein 1-like isoform X1 [Cucurbita pepo subsp. pepo]|uniref:PH, RCC1 and FYVE domains-containing protein 1-like isoform X1 n=1 Tax=Cucurbita pepo subsp. pepo TaxID=3664 RepID=UPI000C9D6B35|nr:PH, RCC1 and FYVE domains-containing protein 1-like isoform X1 [Cucurbita pepo subsp. pepo]